MRNIIIGSFVFISAFILLSQDAFGGAWTVPKYKVWGEYYIKWRWSDEDFGAAPEHQPEQKANDARSWGWSMEPKIEYGITDWLNLLLSLEYKEEKYKEYSRPAAWGPFRRKNHGVSAVRIGGKVRFLENPVVASGLFRVHIYPGYGNFNGDDPAFRNQPAIGTGEDIFEFRGLLGKQFYLPVSYWFGKYDQKIKFYGGLETGWRFKNRSVCNDFPFFVEGGFWPFDWVLLKGEIDGVLCQDGTGAVEKDYAFWRIGPVFHILAGDAITRQGVMFNIELQYGQTFWGRNTSRDQEIVLKVQSQF